jgi:hypothetical protein
MAADRALEEFGYDVPLMESFLRLTPDQKLESLRKLSAFVANARPVRAP